MDLLIWAAMLVVMAVASYRAALLWRGTTTAFDAWPYEYQRAVPAIVWFGTAFFAAGAVLVLGDFGPGHPISIVAALVAVVGGLAALILGASLLIGGRPRRFVPPHLRDGEAPRTTRRHRGHGRAGE
jgi:hypothetical protein